MEYLGMAIMLLTAIINWRTARINRQIARMNSEQKEVDRGNGRLPE